MKYHRKLLAPVAMLVSVLWIGSYGVSAQTITTGDITGTVQDSSGAIVPGATVLLKAEGTGETRTVTSNNAGLYRFTTLSSGQYKISSSTRGLRSDISSVVISIGQVTTLNVTLTPEEAKETVIVEDSIPLLQADSPNISTTLKSGQLSLLPLPGGDTTTPAFTAPGVVVSTGSGYGNFNSHGLPATSNLFTVNGNDNQDPYLNLNNTGSSNITIGANEVAEVAVVQNAYSVAYGRQAGVQVNEVTKSGTNQFHGNLVWNWNGSLLNANDFFNNATNTPKGRANSNQYAASLGGPIIKDKTFFFVDTEGIRYVLLASGIVAVPTQQFENYALSQVRGNATQSALYRSAFDLYNSAPGHNRASPVSNGRGPLQDNTEKLGCGSLAGTPAPGGGTFGIGTNSCVAAYNFNVINQNTEWLLTTRIDQQITDKQKIFFRFKTDHGLQPTHTDFINPAFNAQSNQPAYEGQIDHTYVISPNIVNHGIFSVSWYSAVFGPADIDASLATFPTYFRFSGTGGPTGSGGHLTNLGLNNISYPEGRNVAQGQIIDDLSIIKGNHSFKLGGNFRKNQVSDYGPQTLTRAGAYTFTDPTDFATGTLASGGSLYEQSYANFLTAHTRFYNLGLYLQDEWAVTPQLKLTLGIRFDRTGNPSCVENCFARLTSQFNPFVSNVDVPYNRAIVTGLRHEAVNFEPVVYQPRIGFVWSPGKSHKTVLRGGIGIFSDLAPGQTVSSIFSNAPNIFTPNVTSGLVGLAGLNGSAAATAGAANAAFQQSFASGGTLAQISSSMPAGSPFVAPNVSSLPDKVYNPKYAEWSFEVQRQLDSNSAISVSYVGTHGYNLILENNLLNAAANATPGFGLLPPTTPDPRFGTVTVYSNNGVSNYSGFTVQYRRALSHGFQGQINYTWSHSLDDVSQLSQHEPYNARTSLPGLLYPYNKSLNYGNSDFDIRHSLTADFTWELPYQFRNHLLDAIAGGWTMGGRVYARTGYPFSPVYDGLATSLTPNGGWSTSTVSNALLATLISPTIDTNCTNVNKTCFTENDFTNTGFGNISRNSFRGPGYFDIDYQVSKTIPIHERYQFRIGASFYNLLNHPNFDVPQIAVNGGGTITSTVAPPTSAYGSSQGSVVSGRAIVTNVIFTF
jgi:hypothetical protein